MNTMNTVNTVNTMNTMNTVNTMNKSVLLKKIQEEITRQLHKEFIISLRTRHGNTQSVERIYIEKIGKILTDMGLDYTSAGSQQSKDFRNIGGTGLNIEVKKTDSFKIKCNDTCPTRDIDYVIIYTKESRRYSPQIVYINGQDILDTSPWVPDYFKGLDTMKNTYGRGDNKKNLPGMISVYPRPNIDVNIKCLLKENPKEEWYLYGLLKPQLIQLCKDNNLAYNGTKKDLITRLQVNKVDITYA